MFHVEHLPRLIKGAPCSMVSSGSEGAVDVWGGVLPIAAIAFGALAMG